ncbi:MAG: hypothetical protein Q8R25_04165 [bacterium]|nr:hypothetical protein [bacterium]
MKTAISIILAATLIGGAFIYATRTPEVASTENVYVGHGTQFIDITAKGTYFPQLTAAKADMPTVLRMHTNGTFDCTASLTVSAVGYRAMLPPSGTTEIAIPPQKAGTTLQGICAMGMYSFKVAFE